MDKLRFFLYFAIVLLVLCLICLLLVQPLTLEFWLTAASAGICAVVALCCVLIMRRKK